MSEIFSICCKLTEGIGLLFGWNYYETQTYLFLVLQPAIYILLGVITMLANAYTAFKCKNILLRCVFVIIAAIGGYYAYKWWGVFSTDYLPYLGDATELCKREMRSMWKEGKTQSGYELINYQRFVYYFIIYSVAAIIANIPQYLYRKHRG